MAECSYARCLQERRLIKRELMKHSKEMLHLVGLERIAEELMGLRKWKQYQEAFLLRNHINSDSIVAIIDDNDSIVQKKGLDRLTSASQPDIKQLQNSSHHQSMPISDTEILESCLSKASQDHNYIASQNRITTETNSSLNQPTTLANKNIINNNNNITAKHPNLDPSSPDQHIELKPEPIDWTPNDKCYFCANGKLLTVNTKGELVAESGPNTGSGADHVQRLDCDTDSNESSPLTANVNNLPLVSGGNRGSGGHSLTESNRLTLNKLLTPQLKNMTSMDSMAVRLAAIQTISGQLLPNFSWTQQQQPQQQQQQPTITITSTTSETSDAAAAVATGTAAALSSPLKDSSSPSDVAGEQPLDLSSKPSPNANTSLIGELKSVRIKPARSIPVSTTARRTYSEDDLNNALQEILTGRLGTRKASIQYNVPRSTLRNKIFKLTLEARRNNDLTSAELLQLQKELEKDLSEDEDDLSNSSTLQHEELAAHIATPIMLRKLRSAVSNDADAGESPDPISSRGHSPTKLAHLDSSKSLIGDSLSETIQPAPPPIPALDTALLLQTLLLSDKNLRDLFSALLLNSTINLKEVLLGATAAANSVAAANENNNNAGINLNNNNNSGSSGSQAASTTDYRPLLQLLLQQQQQTQQQVRPSNLLQSQFTNRHPSKADTPDNNLSTDLTEACNDAGAILKIPSYTPVAGSSTSLGVNTAHGSISPALLCNNSNSNSTINGNGDSPGPLLLAAAVNAAKSHLSGSNMSVTPPLMHPTMESQSPQSLRMCDVIANSIHRTMNEQANKDVQAAAASMMGLTQDGERSNTGEYKKPTISVVKNIGGTDTSRFGAAPNLLAAAAAVSHNSHHQHHQATTHLQHAHHAASHHLSRQEAAALAAGKGTRPKRGKYRNYDRDSLVEAVKAVQRGEMSVHRAGSYYGVPHSTLEYKVKERHLMRPRKREPKPQLGLDSSSSTSGSSAKTNANIPTTLNSLDKLKGSGSSNANLKQLGGALKNNGNQGVPAAFTGAAGNGMKLPIFEPALAHLSYAPHLFWQHPQAAAFSQLQMDFNRNTAAAAAAAATVSDNNSPTDTVGGTSDILKSHMQRYPEATSSGSGGVLLTQTTNSSNAPSPIASPISGADLSRARELYENSAANGASFLDGIIRKTLDRKTNEISTAAGSSGVLLDQLLMKKTPMPFTNQRLSSDYNNLSSSNSGQGLAAVKRLGSPLSLTPTPIKRERNSPHSATDGEDETSQSGMDEIYENNNNNNKNTNVCLKSMGLESQRGRLGSRDSTSETDASSLRSEVDSCKNTTSNNNNHLHNSGSSSSNNNNNLSDLNGSNVMTMKVDLVPPPITTTTTTSILQEKLSQIKAEQQEAGNEENL